MNKLCLLVSVRPGGTDGVVVAKVHPRGGAPAPCRGARNLGLLVKLAQRNPLDKGYVKLAFHSALW